MVKMRILLVILFIANIGTILWIWWDINVDTQIASGLLNYDCSKEGELQLQVRAGRNFRDYAFQLKHILTIASVVLLIDTIAVFLVAINQEAGRKKNAEKIDL